MKNIGTNIIMAHCKGKHSLVHLLMIVIVISSCSVSKKINKQANLLLLQDTAVGSGHIGISIFEPASNTYWYNYNAAKYFVPASNTKLFSLYAGLKYLGDSLIAARYFEEGNALYIQPTGDPSFLHPAFFKQPLLNLLQSKGERIYISNPEKTIPVFGAGWSWDDYDQGYVSERAAFPVYGNLLWLSTTSISPKNAGNNTIKQLPKQSLYVQPSYFADKLIAATKPDYLRAKNENIFFVDSIAGVKTIPFITNNGATQQEILSNILHKKCAAGSPVGKAYQLLKSQPTDSLFIPMMHNSDNFFAEQTLLMASNEHLGFMNDEAIIDTLLKLDLKDLPQRPTWVDGSGLSRYNLFTPQSMVYLLNKMKNEFGLERLKHILPTGNTGTLKNYYVSDSAYIFAKTGTLGGTVALSGFLITQKNKLLIFSVLTNNFKGRASAVRRAVEKFIQQIRRQY